MSRKAIARLRNSCLATYLLCVSATLTFAAPPAAAASNPCQALSNGQSRYQPGPARTVLFAIAADYGTAEVDVVVCVMHGDTWQQTLSTAGHIGINGFAEPNAKREGDGKSPTGSYPLTEAFGEENPGTELPYRTLRHGACWGSTSGDHRYNTYYRGKCLPADEDLTELMNDGPYKQVVVIDYNRPPHSPIVHGNGSAIFLHAGSGPTAGCVALARPELETIIKTLRPHDRIIMGPMRVLFR
ncbi:L,D-transpeptidase family protein [Nocardia sp. XZ_19_369]|uniref:L,D-transpeptidase family protein n=1 Tax=Nocardia sp. XZ_19_369 TaxID=2769487 RepID=UPI00188F7A28|nr:L,D-transpeptidase family protein [Nocardia sp. XZ_19_369]